MGSNFIERARDRLIVNQAEIDEDNAAIKTSQGSVKLYDDVLAGQSVVLASKLQQYGLTKEQAKSYTDTFDKESKKLSDARKASEASIANAATQLKGLSASISKGLRSDIDRQTFEMVMDLDPNSIPPELKQAVEELKTTSPEVYNAWTAYRAQAVALRVAALKARGEITRLQLDASKLGFTANQAADVRALIDSMNYFVDKRNVKASQLNEDIEELQEDLQDFQVELKAQAKSASAKASAYDAAAAEATRKANEQKAASDAAAKAAEEAKKAAGKTPGTVKEIDKQ